MNIYTVNHKRGINPSLAIQAFHPLTPDFQTLLSGNCDHVRLEKRGCWSRYNIRKRLLAYSTEFYCMKYFTAYKQMEIDALAHFPPRSSSVWGRCASLSAAGIRTK